MNLFLEAEHARDQPRGEKKDRNIYETLPRLAFLFLPAIVKKYGYYVHGRKIKIGKDRRKRRTEREEEKPKIGRIDNPDEYPDYQLAKLHLIFDQTIANEQFTFNFLAEKQIIRVAETSIFSPLCHNY